MALVAAIKLKTLQVKEVENFAEVN